MASCTHHALLESFKALYRFIHTVLLGIHVRDCRGEGRGEALSKVTQMELWAETEGGGVQERRASGLSLGLT